jgi:hypothetical protein
MPLDGLALLIVSIPFVGLSVFSGLAIRNMRWLSLKFEDGFLIGTIYFAAIPLFLTILSGTIQFSDMHLAPFTPLANLTTTLNLQLGWAIALGLQVYRRASSSAGAWGVIASERRNPALLIDTPLFIAVLIIMSAFTFIVSGRASGGHWQASLGASMQDSTSLIIASNFANAFRAMFFGLLVWLVENRQLKTRNALAFGAIIVLADILITFNRITAAYFAIAALIMLRRHFLWCVLAILPALPSIIFVSHLWTTVRGLALTNGYSLAGFRLALKLALADPLSTGGPSQTLAESSNSLFETSNLQVFHYLVSSSSERFPLLWGWTLLLRPIAVFIPSTFWPGKPPAFGALVGAHVTGLNVALNSTPFGEAWGNFGQGWPIIFIPLIVVYGFLFSAIGRLRPYFNFMSFFAAIAVCRFDLNFLSICAVGLLTFHVLLLVIRRLMRTPKSQTSLSKTEA